MASALAATLAAPLHELAATVGPGWAAGEGPASVFAAVRDQLSGVSSSAAGSWRVAGAGWTGSGADAAGEFSSATVAAVEALAARAEALGVVTTRAGEAVARARARLQGIIDDFEARAAAMDPDAPGAEAALVAQAQRALDEATAVVDELRAELDVHAAAAAEPASPATWPASASTGATGFGGPAASPVRSELGGGSGLGGLGSGLGGGLGSGLGGGLGSGFGGGVPSSAGSSDFGAGLGTHRAAGPLPDAAMFGSGVAIALPDGSTATAPNAVAADAVRHALTQLGVPYDWGGTTPGVGLDCSGLTQWAYHEAGLDLPRLAQEQDVGAAVTQGALRPGDLAVWDGHVAMIVGNGQMIEAGDPIHLSLIRTTNAGQGFQGFWRPTA
jgi:cell wall-associated NlpC family hydrolase